MEVDRYVGSRFDRSVVAGGEASSVLVDDLGDDRFDRIATERQHGVWAFRAPAGEVPVGDRQAGLDGGARVVGIEIGPGDGPTAFRDPVAGLEIDRLERSAEPAPVVRRATEVAKSGCLQWEIREPDDVADVQVVDLVLVFEAAAFEDDDLQGRSGKLTGDRHSGRTASDDAKVRVDHGIGGDISGVDDHGHRVTGVSVPYILSAAAAMKKR